MNLWRRVLEPLPRGPRMRNGSPCWARWVAQRAPAKCCCGARSTPDCGNPGIGARRLCMLIPLRRILRRSHGGSAAPDSSAVLVGAETAIGNVDRTEDRRHCWNMSSAPTRNDLEIVRRIPMFRGLAPLMVEKLIAPAIVLTMRDGGIVFRQGDPAAAFFIVVEGWVQGSPDHRIRRRGRDPRFCQGATASPRQLPIRAGPIQPRRKLSPTRGL